MKYKKELPPMRYLLNIAKYASFPSSREEIVQFASNKGFAGSTIDFLKLFPADEIFQGRADFITRCDELELMIREERKMPAEAIRSPQG